jgi:hypothetical protein
MFLEDVTTRYVKNRREDYKKVMLKTQPACSRTANVMRSKTYEAA